MTTKHKINKQYHKMIMTGEWYEKAKEFLKIEGVKKSYDHFKQFCVKNTVYINWKTSYPLVCMCMPPRMAAINYYDKEDKLIGRRVIGREKALGNCAYCGKPWSEHNGYVEPPESFGYQGPTINTPDIKSPPLFAP